MHNLLNKIKTNQKAILILGVLFIWFSLFFFKFIVLQTADLGRYIVNGREIVSGGFEQVTHTNTYSFAHPNYKFINHHWFFGILVYGVYSLSSFSGLSIFSIVSATLAFGMITYWSYKKYGLFPAVVSATVFTPLIASRTEIRPELISLLGVVIYFLILEKFVHKKMNAVWVWVLLLTTQLIWQNTHLFFVFGQLELFLFWLYAGAKKNMPAFWQLGFLGLVSAGVTLLNPNGLAGALIPFNIFAEYGYSVAENQTLWFMLNRFHSPIYYYEVLVAGTLTLASFLVLRSKTKKQALFPLLLLLLSSVLAVGTFKVNRLESFWGIMSIPLGAWLCSHLTAKAKKAKKWLSSSLGMMVGTVAAFVLVLFMAKTGLFLPVTATTGVGLSPGVNNAAEFIKENNLSGPIFNNYDIGGYLIYHLYPEEQVFVDNRPEAYPVDFFREEYIRPQEDNTAWRWLDNKYNFNLIVFFRHDMTDWAQKFMISRVADEHWVPIYVDGYSIIFVKNTQENADIISTFEIPQETFSVKDN